MHFLAHFGRVKKSDENRIRKKVLHGALVTEALHDRMAYTAIWAMPMKNNIFQKGASLRERGTEFTKCHNIFIARHQFSSAVSSVGSCFFWARWPRYQTWKCKRFHEQDDHHLGKLSLWSFPKAFYEIHIIHVDLIFVICSPHRFSPHKLFSTQI